MTPCEKLGYKIGDKFEALAESNDLMAGTIVTLHSDDGSEVPYFTDCDGDILALCLNGVVPTKKASIKPESEITIPTTYGALAEVYAVMGNANGDAEKGNLWNIAKKVLDPNRRVLDELSPELTGLIDYESIREEWLEALFPTEVECLKQKQLQEVISNLEDQLQEAKDTLKSIKGE